MDPLKRESLTVELQALVAETAKDILAQLRRDTPSRGKARALHAEERVGGDFDVWLDLLARRAAVLWVLKTVYVRVLEDRGFIAPVRLRDRSAQELFHRLAPALADTAFLQWVFRDLASQGGLPELFADLPAEVAAPSNSTSKRLLDFWRQTDESTQQARFRFDDEHFDGRLMGDLYQDLDPVVKEKFALLQTPDFVVDLLLDETLTPAISEFGVETVRVIDPACGSGHFLLAAFKRVFVGMREKFPYLLPADVARDVLGRIVGIDLNDYACGLARARLLMTALEAAGDSGLAAANDLQPQVYWADGLEQVEAAEQIEFSATRFPGPRAALSPPETRGILRDVLTGGFHVVIANPPFITETDSAKKEYHRPRYRSAYREYSLGVVFTERLLQLARTGGYVGEITSNSFMRREFGRALIERVLPQVDITQVIDTSGAHIPGHGTPTVILLLRKRAPSTPSARVVMGKRAEAGIPAIPALGPVWSEIAAHFRDEEFEGQYVTVGSIDRLQLSSFPWTLAGGGALELMEVMRADRATVGSFASAIGFMCIPKSDDAFVLPVGAGSRGGIPGDCIREFVSGQDIQHWHATPSQELLFPYDEHVQLREPSSLEPLLRRLWPHRTTLFARKVFGGGTFRSASRRWYEYGQIPSDRFDSSIKLAFSAVSTHNRFVCEQGQRVFKDSAPVVIFRPDVSDSERLHLLGVLNASTAGFWLRQVSQNKGARGEGGGLCTESWEQFFQFAGRKVESVPVPALHPLVTEFATALHQGAKSLADDSIQQAILATASNGSGALRAALDSRRARQYANLLELVALQEDLDWLCYRLYGLDSAPESELRSPSTLTPIRPGLRPFEVSLARADMLRREAIEQGMTPDEAPTAWFERHGWRPVTTLDELPPNERAIVEARLARTANSRNLGLLEQAHFKRRWYCPDFAADESEALRLWLVERLEEFAKSLGGPFTAQDAAAALQAEPSTLAVAEVLSLRADFDLAELFGGILTEEAVPNAKHHLFKPSGLVKRAVWERTWSKQRDEDAAARAGAAAASPPAPPKYSRVDFLRDDYWGLRGALDVSRERFTALTEVPGRTAKDRLYSWAGLSHRERARMFVELDERAERAGVPVADRVGLLYAIQFLADYVAWESEAASNEYRSAVTAVVGQGGVADRLLDEWAARNPPPQSRGSTTRARMPRVEEDTDES